MNTKSAGRGTFAGTTIKEHRNRDKCWSSNVVDISVDFHCRVWAHWETRHWSMRWTTTIKKIREVAESLARSRRCLSKVGLLLTGQVPVINADLGDVSAATRRPPYDTWRRSLIIRVFLCRRVPEGEKRLLQTESRGGRGTRRIIVRWGPAIATVKPKTSNYSGGTGRPSRRAAWLR